MADSDIDLVLKKPFEEQVRFFRNKLGNLVPTQTWTDVWKEQHDRAFMVAGAMKADLLTDLFRTVEKSISEGKSIQWFRANFDEIVAKHGWNYRGGRNWRTRVIYQTNISTSYSAGRLAQLNSGGFPFWMYKHSDSVMHPRPLHVSWDGLVLAADNDWWKTHYPPNGWGCKCRVVGIRNAAMAKRRGGRMLDAGPDDGINPLSGEPNGIDKGWGYQPGASIVDDLRKQILEKIPSLPPPIASALQQDISKNSGFWDITTTTGKWHEAAFGDAPEWLKKAVSKIGEVVIAEKVGTKSFCMPNGSINIGHRIDTPLGKVVWRHEFGHNIDFKLAQHRVTRSSASDFSSAMDKDGNALLTGSGLGRRSSKQATTLLANRSTPKVLAEHLQTLDKAGRTDYLFKAAKDVGVDIDAFRSWFTATAAPGDLEIGGVLRDWFEAQFLSAWKRTDAQGLLDALEKIERGADGQFISGEQSRAYNKGLAGIISDLFSAASNKHVEGCGSHTAGYYKKRAGWGREAESWANICSIAGSGQIGEALLERFVPEMFKVFKEVIS